MTDVSAFRPEARSDYLQRDYKEMLKAKRNTEYLEKIDRGIAQLEAGKGHQHDLIEVSADKINLSTSRGIFGLFPVRDTTKIRR